MLKDRQEELKRGGGGTGDETGSLPILRTDHGVGGRRHMETRRTG